MTVHLCRDYQTLSYSSQTSPGFNDMSGYACAYIMAAFMRYTLGYTQVGATNFNLNGSPLLIANSTSNTATVNSDGSVTIPSIVYAVSNANDPGRMIVLKSPGNPSTNSGVFLITGINGNVSFPNSYVVSARIGSSGLLVPETGLQWAVLESDTKVTGNSTQYGWGTIWGGSSNYGSNVALYTTTANMYTFTASPPTSIAVASAAGYASPSGEIFIQGVPYGVNYTGISGNTFTGCVAASGGFSGPYVISAGTPVYNNVNANTGTSYAGNGNAITPRIILQSPHATGWQVRICLEPSAQIVYSSIGDPVSVAPGFLGNSAGDFPLNSPSLNGGLFYNNPPYDTSYKYAGTTVGFGARAGFSAGSRITCVGDDTGQSVTCFCRVSSTNGVGTGYVSFGLPDNEPTPLPPTSMQRLFIIGEPSSATNGLNGISCSYLWNGGGNSIGGKLGLGFGLDESICSCSPSCWEAVYQSGGAQGSSPMFSSNAGDSPFLLATELLPVDLVNGVFYSSGNYGGTSLKAMAQQPRTIGTMPFLRAGRANYAQFQTTTDVNRSWLHFQNGVYMQYGGPQVIP